jgi:hypothetical protein
MKKVNKNRLRLKKPKTKEVFIKVNGLLQSKIIRVGIVNEEWD